MAYPPRGVWFWVEDDVSFESTIAPGYIDDLLRQGVGRVYLKIMDDLGGGKLWQQAEVIPELVRNGIQVFGWGYHFTTNPKTGTVSLPNVPNIVESINKALDLGMTGYVFDLEVELTKNPYNDLAVQMIRAVKSGVKKPLTLGYSSFGAPDLHQDFPYAILQAEVDCQFPQIYYDHWKGDSKELIEKCLEAHDKMGLNKKPIYPVFSDEVGAQFRRSLEENQARLDEYPGASFWRWPQGNENVCVNKLVYGTAIEPKPQPTTSIREKLFSYYSQRKNYDLVYDKVSEWFAPMNGGSTVKNGCVAFMSTALRMIGMPVPIALDATGENISTLTKPFSAWLMKQGWKKITDSKTLMPGDILFSEDEPGYPGYPAHTYMFHSWDGPGTGYAIVIDNQGFKYSRNITASSPKTPFAYALREYSSAPQQQTPPTPQPTIPPKPTTGSPQGTPTTPSQSQEPKSPTTLEPPQEIKSLLETLVEVIKKILAYFTKWFFKLNSSIFCTRCGNGRVVNDTKEISRFNSFAESAQSFSSL